MSTLAPGSRSEGLSTTALPHAMAFGTIHSGTMHGKLNGVMHPTTPIGWRSDRTSTPPDTCGEKSPFRSSGTPHANSMHSRARCTSPAASASVLPCCAVMTAARSCSRRTTASRTANSTWARSPSVLSRHDRWASTADRDGGIHLLDGGEIDLRGDGSGGGVVDVAGAAGRARCGAAGDDVCDAVHGLEPTTGRCWRHWGDRRAWHDPSHGLRHDDAAGGPGRRRVPRPGPAVPVGRALRRADRGAGPAGRRRHGRGAVPRALAARVLHPPGRRRRAHPLRGHPVARRPVVLHPPRGRQPGAWASSSRCRCRSRWTKRDTTSRPRRCPRCPPPEELVGLLVEPGVPAPLRAAPQRGGGPRRGVAEDARSGG